jgi:hypothetical protein
MVRGGKKQWLYCTFTGYLAIALMGAVTFSIVENFRFDEPGKNQISSGGVFTAVSHTVDWLIEDPKTIGKSTGQQGSPLRNGAMRALPFEAVCKTTGYRAGLFLQSDKDNPPRIEISSAPQKLRI